MTKTSVNLKEVRTVRRAFEVLEAVNAGQPLTVSEIAHRTQLPRPTAARMVCSLERREYVARVPGTLKYELHAGIFNLFSNYGLSSEITRVSRKILDDTSKKFIWPLILTRPKGCQMEVLYSTDFNNPFALEKTPSGMTLPIFDTAMGPVFVGHMESRAKAQFISAIEAHEKWGRQKLSQFKASVLSASLNGYAFKQMVGEREKVLAVPVIFDRYPVAAVGIRFISSAVAERKALIDYLQVLRSTACELASELKWVLGTKCES